ncbi:Calcium-binding mitochondrial protein Anon-60Da, putative [Brugia malayi]|uniref:Mitochondrial proton/calcium exchanger protein n=1 Tax=Brugia malayi TaxID=6279 RepID=A0A0H5S117_BRUMA|nr:Calcium-binding mitochondrial protein Anon-60Da, putative [Brugia malayi]CRZ22295.1 BMA-LETM-1 [Brugia malayi]VIO88155.1 Calcium-binding mitochondrial protein Anon-60Da, putative [Brugia malayi]
MIFRRACGLAFYASKRPISTLRLRSCLVRFSVYETETRTFHRSCVQFLYDKSKLEETLKRLKEQATLEEKEGQARKQMVEKAKQQVALEPVYIRWPKAFKKGCKHYYHGFRLLFLEMRLSAKYLWRFLRRKPLLRREKQQLVRTLSDVLRLIPFSAFVIVPFMEFTLPFFLKLFPNMLPSTFKDATKEEEKLRRKLTAKLETAKLLQAAMEEMALYKKKNAKDDDKTASIAVEFAEFIKKVRSEGSYVTNKDLLKYIKLFEDELTLDNLPANTLRALCRLLNIQPFGSLEIIRFQLSLKLRALRADDQEIALEGGVDTLTVPELQQACRARGMRSLGMSEERLKEQLKQWLELSLNDKVPQSLLLLSRTIYLPEDITFMDRLKALITSLPDNIAEETRQNLAEIEGDKVSYGARLRLIQNIEKAIDSERKAMEEAKKKEAAKKAEEEKIATEAAKAAVSPEVETVAKFPVKSPSPDKASVLELTQAATPQEKTITDAGSKLQIDEEHVQSIENVIHGNAISEAKYDIRELKEQISEHNEDLEELDSFMKDLKEPRGAKILRARVNKMMKKADKLLEKLDEDKKAIGEISESAADEEKKMKEERLMRVEDLIGKMQTLQKMNDEDKEEFRKILQALDEDSDGVINVNLVLHALALFGSHKELRLTAEQIKTIVEMLKKEEHIEAMKAFLAGTAPYPPSSSSSSAVAASDSDFSADPTMIIKQKFSVDPTKTSNETLKNQTLNKLPTDMKQNK